ncbi:MAG: APC family permease, partial [Victivallaceae bacterium]|nr:APC family permease [Victivallaceae bacterium]
ILVCLWGCTLLNWFGIRIYARISMYGVLLGTIFPTILLVILAGKYFLGGAVPALHYAGFSSLMPQLNSLNDWMLLAGMMVSLAGIDMTALHITDVKKPKRNYPLALLFSAVVIFASDIAGSLAIALVVPSGELGMASGASEAFTCLFAHLGLPEWNKPVLLLLSLGAITTVLVWLLGPVKGLWEVAREKRLPAFLAEKNAHGVPGNLLLLQSGAISVISLVIFFTPDISSAFWVFMALSAQMYMLMYLLMFAAAFALRLRRPELARPFAIPGGLWGVGAVTLLGSLSALAAMIAGFIPPSNIRALGTGPSILYACGIGAGTLCFASVAYFLLGKKARLPDTPASARDQNVNS